MRSDKPKMVVILGASGAIGAAMSLKYASQHNLCLVGRHKNKLDNIKKKCEMLGSYCDICVCDFTNYKNIDRLKQKLSGYDIETFINCSGVKCPAKPLQQLTNEEIHEMVQVNLVAIILLVRYVYQRLLKQGHGSIININSMVGLEAKKNRTIYSSTKWGARGFFDSLRQEALEANIRVMEVYPTNIKTSPDINNAMDLDFVVNRVYDAHQRGANKVILDGRIKYTEE